MQTKIKRSMYNQPYHSIYGRSREEICDDVWEATNNYFHGEYSELSDIRHSIMSELAHIKE